MSTNYDRGDGGFGAQKTPILASIFTAVGWLVVASTVLLSVVSFQAEQKLLAVPAVLIFGGCGGFVALIFFGIAQVLESIAKIEYHTSCEKNEAILNSLHKIEGHLAAIRETKKLN